MLLHNTQRDVFTSIFKTMEQRKPEKKIKNKTTTGKPTRDTHKIDLESLD